MIIEVKFSQLFNSIFSDQVAWINKNDESKNFKWLNYCAMKNIHAIEKENQ